MDDGIVMKRVQKDMLGAATRINHSLAAISVGVHSTELIICKRICVTALVVMLLLQLLKKRCTGVAPEILQFKLLVKHWKIVCNNSLST